MQNAIITGPTGLIGTALIQYLADKNIEVYAIVRPNSKRKQNIPNHPKVHVIECELSELDHCKMPHEDFTNGVFYHLGWEGASGPYRNNMLLQTNNIRATLNAVSLAARLKCYAFVGAGSQAEYGRVEGLLTPTTPAFPENGYGMAKLCAGQMSREECQNLGIRHCWTRILSIYGRNDGENTLISSAMRNLTQNTPTEFTPCEQMWDYLYSKDAAKALYLIGEKGKDGSIYCIGSGMAKPLSFYLETIRDIINPNAQLGIGVKPYAPKQVMHLCADITNLTEDTGFTPDYTFEEGIKDLIK